MSVEVRVGDGDRELADRLEMEIDSFNAATTGLTDGRRLTVRAVQGETLAGGLSGWTWGGCGYVETLWVADGFRRQGVGTTLMDAAEREIAARGCIQVVLATHSFQAPEFYRRRGYTVIAEVADYPVGHAEIHLMKRL